MVKSFHFILEIENVVLAFVLSTGTKVDRPDPEGAIHTNQEPG